MKKQKTITTQLIRKLSVSFFFIMLLAGVAFVFITIYFSNKYVEESTQKLNKNVASDIIAEKFPSNSPFDSVGGVNKVFFGDLMHDMMSVNRALEVYLVDEQGGVLYSVVLNHDAPNAAIKKINLAPVKEFIKAKGEKFILGDDPRQTGKQKIFSAAHFEKNGHSGYLYVVLGGVAFEQVTGSLFQSYAMQLGVGSTLIAILLAAFVGVISIYYLTRNLRGIIYTVKRFKEGDMDARITEENSADMSILANTFNEMADTLTANIEKIKSVESLRKELVANISHDLRSPLAVTSGYIETLQMKNADLSTEEREQYLLTVQKSLTKLEKLVTQLFEYSKLESNQVETEKEPFLITELASDVISNYQILAQQKGITLDLKTEKNVPAIFADISLVERVLQNLIDNALKFTPDNGVITLAVKANKADVEISVADNGPGIPEEELVYIFERFRKAEKNKSGGAGLGLAIVKKIMEIHQSTINVMSKPNEGTVFQFQLPYYVDQTASS